MNLPCPQKISCECIDSPFENLSSELPDSTRYVKQVWKSPNCREICVSAISQEDADICALLLAEECVSGGALVGNDPLTACVNCP